MKHKYVKTFRKEPSQDRSRDLVSSVFTAGYTLLSKESFSSFTSQKVAQLAGVGIGSIYDYFYNKEGLLRFIVEKEIEKNLQKLEEVLEASNPESPKAAIQALVPYFFNFVYAKKSLIMNFLYAMPREVLNPMLMQSRHRGALKICHWLNTRFPNEKLYDLENRVFFVVNSVLDAIHSYVLLEKEKLPSFTREQMIQKLTTHAIDIILAPQDFEPKSFQ